MNRLEDLLFKSFLTLWGEFLSIVCPLNEYDGTVMFPFKVAVSENIYKEEVSSGSTLRQQWKLICTCYLLYYYN